MKNIEVEILIIIQRVLKKMYLIVIAAAICGSLTYQYTNTHRTYTYTAKVTLYAISNADSEELKAGVNNFNLSKEMINSYIQVIRTDQFLKQVIDQTGVSYSMDDIRNMMSATAIDRTPFFNLWITCGSEDDAILIANTISDLAPQYIFDVLRVGYIETIDPAVKPLAAITTSCKMKVIGGGMIGAIIPIIIIVVMSLLDTKVRTVHDIKDYYEYPILGSIPKIKNVKRGGLANVKGKTAKN